MNQPVLRSVSVKSFLPLYHGGSLKLTILFFWTGHDSSSNSLKDRLENENNVVSWQDDIYFVYKAD